MNPVPNIISASRGVAALAMLFFPGFSPGFWALYCWCGISDMIDGMLARKMNATTEFGSRIDSVADLIFVICSAIVVLPSVDLPLWIWLWIAAIGMVKVAGIVIGSYRQRKFSIPHSMTNKLTGILLFCLPFAIVRFDALIPAEIACTMATFSLFYHPRRRMNRIPDQVRDDQKRHCGPDPQSHPRK